MNTTKWILFTSICFSIFKKSGFAQNPPKIDSLTFELNRAVDDSIKIELLVQLAVINRSIDFKKSVEYSLLAMELANEVQNEKLLTKVLVNAGVTFLHKGLFDEAVKFFKQQLELGKKIGYENIIGRAYFNLGNVRLVLEDYSKALEYFSNAMKYINSYNENQGKKLTILEQATINNPMGLMYTGFDDFDQAESYFLLGMNATKGISGAEYSYCQVGNNYADLLIKKGEWSKADAMLSEIMPIQEAIQNKPGLVSVLLSSGKVQMNLGNFNLSESYLKKALSLSFSLDGDTHKKHSSFALSKLYDKMDQPDSVLRYLNLSLAYEDSLNIQKAKEELLKNELELQFQEVKSNLEKSHQTKIQKYLLGILGSLLVVVGLVWSYFRLKKQFQQTRSQHTDLKDLHQAVVNTNVKLTEEISLKKQEITLNEMRNTKSKELIDEIASKIKGTSGEGRSKGIDKLVSELSSTYSDKRWADFEIRFSQIHAHFYENLTAAFPNLTMHERRLSAFLKLQMTTKEISNLTGQSPRSIELARTRLRKKLGLTNSDQNLYDFFLSFGYGEKPTPKS